MPRDAVIQYNTPMDAGESSIVEQSVALAGSYVAEPHVSAQIVAFGRLSRSSLLGALTGESPVGDRIWEETLVHFLRLANSSGDNRAAAAISRAITARVAGRLARMTKVWRLGHPPDLAEDVIDEVLTDLYDQLLRPDVSAKFWEIRFWVCFNRRALNILRRRRFEIDQVVAEEDEGWDEDALDRVMGAPAPLTRFDQPETRAVMVDALSRLPMNVRTAFLLKHWSGYQEEPGPDGAPSIASVMGISGRTVRNYLAKAARELAVWRAEAEQNA